jgi:cell division initiation protein
MAITPLDIRKQVFRKTMRGFDADQVNSFLEHMATEFQTLKQRADDTATQLKSCEQRLDVYVKIEKTLNETLLTAQRATDEARVNAQKEAELILKDAHVRAARYEDEARRRVEALEGDIIALRSQRDSFLARFKAMLRTQLELLGSISEDLADTHHAGGDRRETMAEVPAQGGLGARSILGEPSGDNA